MWIFTQQGFFSINTDPTNKSNLQFRARRIADLNNIKAAFPGATKGSKVIKLTGTDYPFRLSLHRDNVSAIVQQMANQIDYANFKDRVKATPGQEDKVPALMDVWHVMNEWGQGRKSWSRFQSRHDEGEDRKTVLLRAAYDLIKRANDEGLSHPPAECLTHYDDTDCDGTCLMDDIAAELNLDDDTPPIKLDSEMGIWEDDEQP